MERVKGKLGINPSSSLHSDRLTLFGVHLKLRLRERTPCSGSYPLNRHPKQKGRKTAF